MCEFCSPDGGRCSVCESNDPPDLLTALRRVLRAMEWERTEDRMTQKEMADTLRDAIDRVEAAA